MQQHVQILPPIVTLRRQILVSAANYAANCHITPADSCVRRKVFLACRNVLVSAANSAVHDDIHVYMPTFNLCLLGAKWQA
jgi:hypothetical protein